MNKEKSAPPATAGGDILTSDQVKLPASRKVYVETNGGSRNQHKHDLQVPFREIALTPSKAMDGSVEENLPVRVYDTSGPWTDPDQKHDVRDGLPALRREWIVARGDVEEYEGREILPQDNGYLTKGAEEYARVSSPSSGNGSASRNGELEDFPVFDNAVAALGPAADRLGGF